MGTDVSRESIPRRGRRFLSTRRRQRESEARLRVIVETSLTAIVTMDDSGRVTDWNPQAEVTFGWKHDEVVGLPLADTIIPERFRDAHCNGLRRYRETGEGAVLGTVIEATALHRSGREFPVELAISPASRSGARVTFIAFVRDLSERKRAESLRAMQFAVTRALQEGHEVDVTVARVLELVTTALSWHLGNVWMVDRAVGVIRWQQGWSADPARTETFQEISRDTRFSPGVGLPGHVWLTGSAVTISDVAEWDNFPRAGAAVESGLRGGVGFPILADERVSGVIEFFTTGVGELEPDVVDVMADIGSQLGQFIERRRAEQGLRDTVARLAEIAATDPLTGLRNRREFERLLGTIPREQFAVLIIDVDNLKHFNDEFGHEAGDTLLRAVGVTLASLIRGWDIIARIGGDEFGALLIGADDQEAQAVAERMRTTLHGISVPYGQARVSIGWAAGAGGADPNEIHRIADEHLYLAKRAGRDRVAGGDASTPHRLIAGSGWREAVEDVLASRQLRVVFQPIVRLEDRRIIGYEALARPGEMGVIESVEEFFAAAHRMGRTRDIDWLCRRVAVAHSTRLQAPLLLFINVSSIALMDPVHDVDQMQLLLRWGGIDPERVVLEITEHEIITDLNRLRFVLAAYREHGIHFAVDDVGEGHSTLELLAAANPEYIKIARSLTATVSQSGSRSAIRAAAAFARSSGAALLAEGVENDVVAGQMAGLGVTLGQGFWLGRPTGSPSPPTAADAQAARATGRSVQRRPVHS